MSESDTSFLPPSIGLLLGYFSRDGSQTGGVPQAAVWVYAMAMQGLKNFVPRTIITTILSFFILPIQ